MFILISYLENYWWFRLFFGSFYMPENPIFLGVSGILNIVKHSDLFHFNLYKKEIVYITIQHYDDIEVS